MQATGNPGQFIIGYSWNADHNVEEEFPGQSPLSIGVANTGKLWYNNRCYDLCTPLDNTKVLGLLLDVVTGSLTLFADGYFKGSMFGVDAGAFDHMEQLRQGAVIIYQLCRVNRTMDPFIFFLLLTELQLSASLLHFSLFLHKT